MNKIHIMKKMLIICIKKTVTYYINQITMFTILHIILIKINK